MNIYAVKDIKAGKFMNIWLETNDHSRERAYDTIRKDTSTIIGQYPTDFELWRLGEYDDKTGEIIPGIEFIKGGAIVEVLQQK